MGRRLGQHFLSDEKVLRQIADLLEINSSDVVVEIGPGHGELTKEFRIQNLECRVIAIEKDEKLVQFLQQKFASDKNTEIIHGDALETLPLLIRNLKLEIRNSNYKVVGNIPYYITGYLLRILGELEHKPELIVLTVQKEVAERICVNPPKMNLLAASVQFWATPTIAGVVNRKAFNPPPEVDSAIIKLVPKTVDKKAVKRYYELIKIIFKQPRKTILNNLSAGLEIPKEEAVKRLTEQGIKPDMRPQNLSVEDLLNLSVDNVFHAKK